MTADISRIFGDTDKFFRNVVRQQGRLPTDAEENHASTISMAAHETSFTETIAPLGTPDDGFKIAITEGTMDSVDILEGSYYLAGARIENDQDGLTYAGQVAGNWLTLDENIDPESTIFCWLEAEERLISPIEDSELIEPALVGADGAARTRMCWRVRQMETDATSCSEAMEAALEAEGLSGFHDPHTGSIQSSGQLSIGFDPNDIDLDLCKPAVEPGYLGNRNNCYRFKISRDGHFIWGEDNASHLYRVAINDAGTISFFNEPRDEYLRPKAGQTVELLRGDVLLPNGEKIAEPDGPLYNVVSGYSDGGLTVLPDADYADYIDWFDALPDAPESRYIYLRVWSGGGEDPTPDIPYTANTAKTLTGTGLSVTFTDSLIPGDSWVVAARPDAPTRVLPWALQDGAGMVSHARRRHVAPLGIANLLDRTVKDCRDRFRPLYRIQSCCTVTVGDGELSHGDVDDIEEAVTLLPEEGGEICLMRGVHRKSLTITGRSNIRISACKGMTRWLPDEDPDKAGDPILTLSETNDISLINLVMQSGETPCVAFQGAEPSVEGGTIKDLPHGGLVFDHCCLSGTGQLVAEIREANLVKIADCEIVAEKLATAIATGESTAKPAMFISGYHLTVERSHIKANFQEGVDDASQRPLGGVQIGGGSERIEISECTVENGCGTGITLGSVFQATIPVEEAENDPATWVEQIFAQRYNTGGQQAGVDYGVATFYFNILVTLAGCFGIPLIPPRTPNDDGTITVFYSDGEIRDILISHNRIENMGQNGIATFPLGMGAGILGGPSDDAVAVAELIVADNHITGCSWDERPDLSPVETLFTGHGGIALGVAEDCAFRDNHIMENAQLMPDGMEAASAGYGTCGISIIYGEDIRVEDNRIDNNGSFKSNRIATGPNAAISAKLVVGGLAGFSERSFLGDDRNTRVRRGDRPALSVHGNVVYAPAGRALRAMAIGPVIVNDNRLTGANPARILTGLGDNIGAVTNAGSTIRKTPDETVFVAIDMLLDLIGGDAVHIVNLGVAEDLFMLLAFYQNREKDGTTGNPETDEAGNPIVTASDLEKYCYSGKRPVASGNREIGDLIVDFALNLVLQAILPPLFQRGGETMFSNNQVSLRKSGGLSESGGIGTISSVFIASLDDIKFTDNQYEVEVNRFFAFFNALLFGTTIRSIANRGQEGALCWLSLYSYGLLRNTTGLNQNTSGVRSSTPSFGINRAGINT